MGSKTEQALSSWRRCRQTLFPVREVQLDQGRMGGEPSLGAAVESREGEDEAEVDWWRGR